MKSFYTLFLAIILANMLTAQKVTIVGNYSEHVVSMCAQGCEFYEIGVFRLTKSLPIDEKTRLELVYQRSVPMVVTGELKIVQDLPTVAGPQADTEYMGKYVDVEHFEAESFEVVNIVKTSISEQDFASYTDKKDYSIKVTVLNPTDRELKLKIRTDFNKFENFKIEPKGESSVICFVKNEGWSSNIKLMLTEQSVQEDDIFKHAYEQGKKSGFLFFYEDYIEIKNITKY